MNNTGKTDIERLEAFLRENFRLDQRIEAIKNRKLYSLEIELTRRCNMECIYCYNSSSRSPDMPEFDFVVLQRVLREAYDYGIRSITYLGGEPTLFPRINEVLKFTKQIGMQEVILYTNGTIMNASLLDAINRFVDSVIIHVDSIDRDVFAAVHSIDRSSCLKYFDLILNNIELLKTSGYHSKKLRHCLTLFKPTYETLEETLQWSIRKENMLTSIFIPLVPIRRGSQISRDNLLGLSEIQHSYEIRASVELRPELLLLGPSEYFKQYQMSACYISADLKVLPYAGINSVVGDLRSERLDSIFDKSFGEISLEKVTFCKDCSSSDYCFGTVAAVLNSEINHPFCWKYSHGGGN